jgi:predicted Rossmann fold flavoprotein
MGISQAASVRLTDSKYEAFGPVLFTHWGMSGPAILKLSAKGAHFLHQKQYEFDFEVTWFDQAQSMIEHHRKFSAAQTVQSTKPTDFTKRFWFYLLERARIIQEKNWADLTAQEMERLAMTLENDLYHAKGKTTFKEEFVTCGGVDLKEINTKTMESKLLPGLFFCGEVMNVDALTGGFNFQAAWTTAWLAAQQINQTLGEVNE